MSDSNKSTNSSPEDINYRILHKLCYDNEIFMRKENYERYETINNVYINQSIDYQKKIVKQHKGQRKNNDSDEESKRSVSQYSQSYKNKDNKIHSDSEQPYEKQNSTLKKFQYDENSNLYFIFLKTFIRLVLTFFIFGGLFGFYYIYRGIMKDNKKTHFIQAFLCWLASSLFWTVIGYGFQKREEKNLKFYGINALTLTEFIYMALFLSQKVQSEKERNTILEELEIKSDQLYFETIDRIQLKSCLSKIKKPQNVFNIFSVKMQKQSNFLSNMSQKQIHQTNTKNWNSGYIVFKRCQKKIFNEFEPGLFFILFTLSTFFVHIFLPIYYLCHVCEDDFDRWNLAVIVLINLLYIFLYLISVTLLFARYDNLECVELLTSLLEIKNNTRRHGIQKMIPTLNIYCISSIKTWSNIRILLLNMNQRIFRFANIFQTKEVIIFLTLSSILLIDYYGTAWEKNQISGNELLLSMVLTNILSRLILQIIPIFLNFSNFNRILLHNKEQIYSIKSKLQNISHHYKLFRKNYEENMKDIIDGYNQSYSEKVLNQKDQWKQNQIQTHDIEQLRAIFEIIRNAELYSEKNCDQKPMKNLNFSGSEKANNGNNNEEKIESDKTQKQKIEDTNNINNDKIKNEKINNEIEYLTQLIRAYKNIYKDMVVHEDKYLLKFLGIFTISYGKAQALVVILIPAIFSFLFSYITRKTT